MPLSSRRISIGLSIAILFLGTSAIASNLNLKKLTSSRELVEHTYHVIDSLGMIRESIKDVERFRRAYFLTDNPTYLKEADPNIDKIRQGLEEFRLSTGDNPMQQEILTNLSNLVNIRLNIWRESLREISNTEKKKNITLLERVDARQIELTEEGAKISQEIINLLSQAEKTELKLLEIRKNQVDLYVKNTTLISNFIYGFSLLLLIYIHWLLLREIESRRIAQNLLDKTNTNLAELVEEKTQSLGKERERLIASQKIAHVGSFEYDIATDQLTWSEETYRIFQYDPNLPPPNNQVLLSNFHPEDLPRCLKVFQQLCQEPLEFDFEYRFQCADGTVKYINSRGESVINHQGEIINIIGVAIDITSRKIIEIELREQAERLNLIIEGSEMATWDWYFPTNQLIWSRRHFGILGLTYPGHCRGDYQAWLDHIHPEDLQRVKDSYDNCTKEGKSYKSQYRIIRSDVQEVRWLSAIGGFIKDETGKIIRSIGVVFDITEQKEKDLELTYAYQRLLKSEQRYRILIEATSQAVWQGAPDGSLMYPIASWQKITGQTNEEMLGFGWLNAVHPDDRQKIQLEIMRALADLGSAYECEYRLYHQSTNTYRHFLARGLPLLDGEGNIQEWIGISTDITNIKLAEELLKENNIFLEEKVKERTAALEREIAERLEVENNLREMTIELERSNEELSQFAYVASHDLQEPLRAIINFSQKIAANYQGRLDDKADLYIEFVVDGANRMQQLVKDLLSYSRVGRKDLNWEAVDLNNVLTKVCHDLQVAIEETQAQITIPPLPLIYGDHSQLNILWQNLLSNSLKYHSDRPLNIEILVVNDHLLPDSDILLESYTLLAIKDNGIGIDSQYNERIFGIFQRLHTTDEYPGTGLGLAICQKIVERHHGKIWVESVLGEGSTFYLVLPKAQ